MLKRIYEGQESCSVARTLEIVGARWTWLLVRDAFLGLRNTVTYGWNSIRCRPISSWTTRTLNRP